MLVRFVIWTDYKSHYLVCVYSLCLTINATYSFVPIFGKTDRRVVSNAMRKPCAIMPSSAPSNWALPKAKARCASIPPDAWIAAVKVRWWWCIRMMFGTPMWTRKILTKLLMSICCTVGWSSAFKYKFLKLLQRKVPFIVF